MSKRITTRWYIGAWLVALIAFLAAVWVTRAAHGGALPASVYALYVVIVVAEIVALVVWIGALVKLAMQRAWGWFAAVLLLQLIGLGIIGMLAYLIAGPTDTEAPVIRPTAT